MIFVLYIAIIFATASFLARNPVWTADASEDQGDPVMIFTLAIFWPLFWFYRSVRFVIDHSRPEC